LTKTKLTSETIERIADNRQNLNILEPALELRRIRSLGTYEVLESDLEDLDKSMQDENQSLAFMSLCAGALLSAVLSWLGASDLSPIGYAIYASSTIVLCLATPFFTLMWLRGKRSKQNLIARIKSRTMLPDSDNSSSTTAS